MASMLLDSSFPHNFSKTVIVDMSEKGQFKTIQEAIDSVPEENDKWFHIFVKPGIYVEDVHITEKTYIFLEGSGPSGDSMTKVLCDNDTYVSTFGLFSCFFVAKIIAFMNSYQSKSMTEPTVAAAIFGDQVAFYNCAFYGLKWTLYDGWGRHFYSSCYIEGAIDFIWGEGTSVFEGCTINVTAGKLNVPGSITAQNRKDYYDKSGFVFINGSVTGTGKVYLGRPYSEYSRVIFSEMTFSSVVHPKGWDAGKFIGKERYLVNVEAGCKGPGAKTWRRAKWAKKNKANSTDLG